MKCPFLYDKETNIVSTELTTGEVTALTKEECYNIASFLDKFKKHEKADRAETVFRMNQFEIRKGIAHYNFYWNREYWFSINDTVDLANFLYAPNDNNYNYINS